MVSKLLIASLLVMGLGIEARADSKVDWSQYIEKPGDHVVNKPASTSQPAEAKPARVAKAATKATTKAKPRSKKAAKRPGARKH